MTPVDAPFIIPTLDDSLNYKTPKTRYCKSKAEFDAAVGVDFIKSVNAGTEDGSEYLVGLSHGQSPAGAYEYIFNHFDEIKHPEKLHFTAVNSKLLRQRGLVEVFDAIAFMKKLLNSKYITKDQIMGRSLNREDIESYLNGLNEKLGEYLVELGKEGLDYVILATDPLGQVAGISRNSTAFRSKDIAVLINDGEERELTFTPHFLKKSARVAFLATKSEKRRPLAWFFYRWAKPNESPSFLRYIDGVEDKMTVFIDDYALTWPQEVIHRKTPYGDTTIRVDIAKPYNRNLKKKKPVILMVHGFLGLNTFDALLAFIPAQKYIAAAFHYGSIPYDLPPNEFSQFVVENLDAVVNYFGKLGHPVYIFDHSIANTYMLMINDQIDQLPGIKNHLKGRISANPFFGKEVKHGAINFIEHVILKSKISVPDRVTFQSVRWTVPFYNKTAVRNNSIRHSSWLIKTESAVHNRIWKAIKQRVLFILTEMDTLPELNKVPIEHTLNRLPIKIFAIQIQSALRESKKQDSLTTLKGYEKYKIPTLVLKSEKDPIAKYVSSTYESNPNTYVLDITNHHETDIFKEHLYYLIRPRTTINIIEQFVDKVQKK